MAFPMPELAPVIQTMREVSLRFKGSIDEREEFVAGLDFITKYSQHGAGRCNGVLFFDTPHHHAEVFCLDDDADPVRIQEGVQGFGNLLREALLHLETAREHLNDPRKLA